MTAPTGTNASTGTSALAPVPGSLAALAPELGNRAFFAGQTGTGKTTLARAMLSLRPYVAVLDVKGTINWPGYTLTRTVDQVRRLDPAKHPRVILRPSWADVSNWSELDRFFRWVYVRGNTTLYVDETYGATQGNTFPEHYGACLTRGREHGIEVWSGSQRPMDVPQIAMSEAEHVYVFRLKMPQDRDKVERFAGVPADRTYALVKRQFLYAPQDGEIQGPFRLALPAGFAAGPSGPSPLTPGVHR